MRKNLALLVFLIPMLATGCQWARSHQTGCCPLCGNPWDQTHIEGQPVETVPGGGEFSTSPPTEASSLQLPPVPQEVAPKQTVAQPPQEVAPKQTVAQPSITLPTPKQMPASVSGGDKSVPNGAKVLGKTATGETILLVPSAPPETTASADHPLPTQPVEMILSNLSPVEK